MAPSGLQMRKNPRDPHLGPVELETLRFVLDHQPTPTRAVAEHFASAKGYARTTVLKTMERLRAKGYLERSDENGVHLYRSTRSRDDLENYVVADFVQMNLGGSVSPLMAFLTRQQLSPDEIEELKALISRLEEER